MLMEDRREVLKGRIFKALLRFMRVGRPLPSLPLLLLLRWLLWLAHHSSTSFDLAGETLPICRKPQVSSQATTYFISALELFFFSLAPSLLSG